MASKSKVFSNACRPKENTSTTRPALTLRVSPARRVIPKQQLIHLCFPPLTPPRVCSFILVRHLNSTLEISAREEALHQSTTSATTWIHPSQWRRASLMPLRAQSQENWAGRRGQRLLLPADVRYATQHPDLVARRRAANTNRNSQRPWLQTMS